MMARADRSLQDLGRDYPEWKPWLAVIEEVLREAADPKWEAFVPERTEPQQSKVPLLSGLTVDLETNVVGRWTQRLIRAAYQSGAPRMATLESVKRAGLNDAVLFEPALCQNTDRLRGIAGDLGVDADALHVVAALVPVPFLQACNRRWRSAISQSWVEGYCPVCGSWPAFAEVRGIERNRHLRCGRCSAEWPVHGLSCPYCGMTDHKEIESLVPEESGTTRAIEACRRCLGYLKSLTTLQRIPAERVLIDDLASVDLDIAALDQGYRKPDRPACFLDVTITNRPAGGRRFFFLRD
jgi:FdhE protein